MKNEFQRKDSCACQFNNSLQVTGNWIARKDERKKNETMINNYFQQYFIFFVTLPLFLQGKFI